MVLGRMWYIRQGGDCVMIRGEESKSAHSVCVARGVCRVDKSQFRSAQPMCTRCGHLLSLTSSWSHHLHLFESAIACFASQHSPFRLRFKGSPGISMWDRAAQTTRLVNTPLGHGDQAGRMDRPWPPHFAAGFLVLLLGQRWSLNLLILVAGCLLEAPPSCAYA